MSQVDPWEKAAECARAIERSTDPDEDPISGQSSSACLSRMEAVRL
jgi:hypothetical protein